MQESCSKNRIHGVYSYHKSHQLEDYRTVKKSKPLILQPSMFRFPAKLEDIAVKESTFNIALVFASDCVENNSFFVFTTFRDLKAP